MPEMQILDNTSEPRQEQVLPPCEDHAGWSAPRNVVKNIPKIGKKDQKKTKKMQVLDVGTVQTKHPNALSAMIGMMVSMYFNLFVILDEP